MAKTAVVNPPRRRKKAKSSKRRRNYGAAASAAPRTTNRRRRRKKSYGAAKRRRRNPSVPSVYGGGGYRRSNPFGLERTLETLPAATLGVFLARAATKLAGPIESGGPGIRHALAIWLAAQFGTPMLGSILGSPAKSEYARIAALGFGGDLFARKRFLAGNAFVAEHLYLEGVDDDDVPDYSEGADLNGFQNASALGESFVDAVGNRYVATAQGWALAGAGDQFVAPDGNTYEVVDDGVGTSNFVYPSNYNRLMAESNVGIAPDMAYGNNGSAVAGFQPVSALGFSRARSTESTSFGYG